MKVADVRLFWTKSPSADIEKTVVTVTLAGQQQVTEYGPEVEELTVVVKANTSGMFNVTSLDSEGKTAVSVTYNFNLGDLEDPLPATNLGHEVLAVRDVPDETPPVEQMQPRHMRSK